MLPDGRSLVFAVDHVAVGTGAIGVLANGTRKNILTIKGEALDSLVYSSTGHILVTARRCRPASGRCPSMCRGSRRRQRRFSWQHRVLSVDCQHRHLDLLRQQCHRPHDPDLARYRIRPGHARHDGSVPFTDRSSLVAERPVRRRQHPRAGRGSSRHPHRSAIRETPRSSCEPTRPRLNAGRSRREAAGWQCGARAATRSITGRFPVRPCGSTSAAPRRSRWGHRGRFSDPRVSSPAPVMTCRRQQAAADGGRDRWRWAAWHIGHGRAELVRGVQEVGSFRSPTN